MLSACKKTGPTSFTLKLRAKCGSQSFALGTPSTDAVGRVIILSNLEFYLSHIKLMHSDGSAVNVTDVALFNFYDTTGLSVTVNNIEGDFSGVSFSCGLDSLANDTTNANLYSPPNPLSASYGMYRPMLNYEFEDLEGKWDTVNIPYANMRNGLSYRIYSNRAFRQTVLNKSFSVSGSPYTLIMYLDVAQIFNNGITGSSINIVTEPYCSSSPADNPDILPAFASNFSHSFTFTGQ